MKRKVFCISGGGASAGAYLAWFKYLPGNLMLELLEIPGRGLRKGEPHVSSFESLIDDFCATITEKTADSPEPYYLFGYCFGGTIAYELCLRMAERNVRPPRRIFLAAAIPTDCPHEMVFANPANEEKVAGIAEQYFPASVFPNRREARQLSKRFVHLLFKRYGQYKTMVPITFEELFPNVDESDPAFIEKEKALDFANDTQYLLNLDLTMDQQIRAAQRTFEHLAVDITALAGRTDPLSPVEEVGRWEQYADAAFDLQIIDGGHGFAFEEPGSKQCVDAVAGADRCYKAQQGLHQSSGEVKES